MLWLKTLFFTVIAPGTVTIVLPYLLLSDARDKFGKQVWQWLGVFPALLGVGIYLWCAKDFAVQGRGTPAPYDPPKQLVVTGLYRFVRNPMYVGIVLILLGEALLFAEATLLLYTALVLFGFHLRVRLYEEPTLQRHFGESFTRYCANVPRWLPLRKNLTT
ncbi:isoprenylcysteine carboxylmethyltransferase family protein [candidate division KSB1 bacterium]|nr:isoprenylcysteine carboxylmethyltransferase family protein [candidate division KSB1 bacterium]